MKTLRRLMSQELSVSDFSQAVLFPTLEHIEQYAELNDSLTLEEILSDFEQSAKLGKHYVMADVEDVRTMARLLQPIKSLTLRERFVFCMAPVDMKDNYATAMHLNMAAKFAAKRKVAMRVEVPVGIPKTPNELLGIESLVRCIESYIWLSHRFPSAFVDVERVTEARNSLNSLIMSGLENMSAAEAQQHLYRRERRRRKGFEEEEDEYDGSVTRRRSPVTRKRTPPKGASRAARTRR
eukprot:TRINITY_DN3431_c0_g1_i1.p1 TRINITY_DN3431_c0_g1~~TRINITY_DN3431_c0_g1_i1.p1  ORF type:complete len:238 (-),score=60.81 TRINITY_DN3431_c0_g1_i1:1-714(-)